MLDLKALGSEAALSLYGWKVFELGGVCGEYTKTRASFSRRQISSNVLQLPVIAGLEA